jgi:hypothetical protein
MPSDEFEQVRSMSEALPDSGELQVLETIPEVLAFTIAHARSEELDKVACVLAVVLAADMSRDDLRHARDVLKKLGYAKVSTMLTELARKAKRTPVTQIGAKE